MNGWLLVGDAAGWPELVEEGRAFVESQQN